MYDFVKAIIITSLINLTSYDLLVGLLSFMKYSVIIISQCGIFTYSFILYQN